MTIENTGYVSALTAVTWSGQGLNGLTDNEWTDLSDEIVATKTMLMDLRLVLASASFTGEDSRIALFLVPSIDGTNYPKWNGNATAESNNHMDYYIGLLRTDHSTGSQEGVKRNVLLPPGKYKLACRNRANVTLAGSGNTLEYRTHSYEDV